MTAHRPSLGWHVITEDGDLTARLRDGLTVGVDDQGLLRFDPAQSASLRFLAGGEGSLIIETVDARARLCDDEGQRRPSSTLRAGQAARVDVGPLAIVLATDVAGALDRPGKVELAVVRDTEPATPEPEAVPAPDPTQQAEPEPEPETETETETEPATASAAESIPATRATTPEPGTMAPASTPSAITPGMRLRRRLNAGMLLVFALFLALAISPRVQRALSPGELPPAAQPLAAPTPPGETVATPPGEPAAEPAEAAAPAANDGPEPAAEEAPPAGTETAAAAPPVAPSPALESDDTGGAAAPGAAPGVEPDSVPDPRIALARRLLEEGAVIAPPERNAVDVVSEVLYDDPTNDDALRLMQRCADTLVDDAQRALFRGDEFGARNLVEEVLAFHPSHEGAKALWQRLTGGAAP